MFGVLNIHKPVGCTSRDVVNCVQRLVRPVKVGHAGTLDPLASGVLLVCLGPATRLIEHAHRFPKHYLGTFLLGCSSDSDDTEAEVSELRGAPIPSRAAIEAALPQFTGEIMQRPPNFSAVKIHGKRSYKLARQGKSVELAEKPVSINSLFVADYQYPHLTLDISCGSGTYIRSLGRDLAAELGTVAVMLGLERTSIGPFHLEQALSMYELTPASLAAQLQSPLTLLGTLPRVTLSEAEIVDVCHGLAVRRAVASGEVAATDAAGNLVAILTSDGDGAMQPHRVLLSERCN